MISITTALALLPLLALAAPASEPAASDANVQILGVTTVGSGCPSGSLSTSISEDKTVVTLGFDKYQTNFGEGAGPADQDRDCLITVNLRYPLGCTAASVEATYHGFAQLEPGLSGAFTANYVLPGGFVTNSVKQNSFDAAAWGQGGTYTKQDVIPSRRIVRSLWERNVAFFVGTKISLASKNGTAAGTLTTDDATISFAQVEKCR